MKSKKVSGKEEVTPLEDQNQEVSVGDEEISEARRAFIKKYGALAAVTPVAMTLTMHSNKALAGSCTECGP